MLNRVILIGRLTKDPELRYTPQGTAVCSFSLAINRKFNREETDFIDIVAWRGLAENCASYLSKGRLAAIEGRIQVRNYENQEGQKRKAVEVVADDVRFLESKASAGKVGGSTPSPRKSSDEWDDLGREVSLEDIDIVDNSEEDEIPF